MRNIINQPMISVLMRVCNEEKFLQKALDSLFSQSYFHMEIIVIDDNSSDNSFLLLQSMRKKDKRLVISRNVKRYGKTVSLNRALKKARGRFIAFMNASDISYKERLKEQVDYLVTHEKTVAVGSQCYFLDEKGHRIGETSFPEDEMEIYKKPLHGISLQFDGIMIDRYRIPKDVLCFHTNKPEFLYSDILVKLLHYGNIGNLPKKLYGHRQELAVSASSAKKEFALQVKQWVRAATLFDHKPSLRMLFFDQLPKPRISS